MNTFDETLNKLLLEKNISNVLFLENGSKDESHRIERSYSRLVDEGYNVTFIDNARHKSDDVIESLKTAEIIIAETSFIHSNEVYGLLKIVLETKPLIIALSVRGRFRELDSFLKNLYPEQLEKLNKHKIYISSTEDDDNKLELLNVDKYIPKKPKLKDYSAANDYHNVIVKRVTAFSEEFQAVKIGINTQYYNYDHPEGYYGVWVAGKTEPVLLINFGDALEWEYEKFDSIDKILHYVASCSSIKKHEQDWVGILEVTKQWVLSAPRETSEERNAIINKFDELIDLLNIPRRGYRNHIRQIVGEYIDSHRYFNEQKRGEKLNPIIR